MRFHNWHSSSTSFRVRIALKLKGVPYENVSVPLSWQDSAHDRAELHAFNPQANIPVLEVDGAHLQQSLAILDYLDREYPEPPIIPADPFARALEHPAIRAALPTSQPDFESPSGH